MKEVEANAIARWEDEERIRETTSVDTHICNRGVSSTDDDDDFSFTFNKKTFVEAAESSNALLKGLELAKEQIVMAV